MRLADAGPVMLRDEAAQPARPELHARGGRTGSRAAEIVLDPYDVVLPEIGAGLHLDDLDRDLPRIGQPVRAARRAGRSNSFSCTSSTSWSRVTSAVPRTTTQCSARWWCFCSDSFLPGATTSRFTRNRSPRSMVWYQPQGRCTRAGVEASLDPPGLQLGDDAAHLLRPLDRRHQHRVGGVDDGEAAHAEDAEEPPVRAEVAVGHVARVHVALARHAVGRRAGCAARPTSSRRCPTRRNPPPGPPRAWCAPSPPGRS